MSRNARRRKAAREATANHGPVRKPNPGANREARRKKLSAPVADLPPLDDRRRQYLRATL